MARKITETTEIKSNKNSTGEWVEYHKVVTRVVERDDDGYPHGPVGAYPLPYGPRSPFTVFSVPADLKDIYVA